MAEGFVEILGRHGVRGSLAERLAVHLELLERWNRTHNLVRFTGREELVVRHTLESLGGLEFLDAGGGFLVDVGSGAGFPGVPLLAAAPSWRGLLIEPRRKRWAFLRTVVRELGLEAEVVDRRYEEVPVAPRSAGAIVSRAMGGYEPLLRWALPRLARQGNVLLWLGLKDAERLRSAKGWRVVTSPLPGLESGRLASCRPCFT